MVTFEITTDISAKLNNVTVSGVLDNSVTLLHCDTVHAAKQIIGHFALTLLPTEGSGPLHAQLRLCPVSGQQLTVQRTLYTLYITPTRSSGGQIFL